MPPPDKPLSTTPNGRPKHQVSHQPPRQCAGLRHGIPFAFPPVLHYGLHVLQCPLYQRIDMREQRMSPGRQRILDPRRHLGVHRAGDVPVVLQRAQRHRQHLLRYVRYLPLQLLEPYGILARFVQSINDQKRPFVAKPGQNVPYRAIGKHRTLYLCPLHNIMFFRLLHKGNQISFKQQKTFFKKISSGSHLYPTMVTST